MIARHGLIHGGLGAAPAGSQIRAMASLGWLPLGVAAAVGRADLRGARQARR